MRYVHPVLIAAALSVLVLGCKPSGPAVSFVGLEEGAEVKSPLEVCMKAQGIAVEPAGEVKPDSGHHHVLVDVTLPADLSKPIPKDAEHVHLGDGSSCTTLKLKPGAHTLRLLFAKGDHVPYDPPLTAKVRIQVTE